MTAVDKGQFVNKMKRKIVDEFKTENQYLNLGCNSSVTINLLHQLNLMATLCKQLLEIDTIILANLNHKIILSIMAGQ